MVLQSKILSIVEMHNGVGLDTLDIGRNLHLMTLIYKSASDDKYIYHRKRVARRGAATLLRMPNPRTYKLTRAPMYKGSDMWNDLPTKTWHLKMHTKLTWLFRPKT